MIVEEGRPNIGKKILLNILILNRGKTSEFYPKMGKTLCQKKHNYQNPFYPKKGKKCEAEKG